MEENLLCLCKQMIIILKELERNHMISKEELEIHLRNKVYFLERMKKHNYRKY